MIGALIGAGMSAASGIFGAIQNRNAMREYNAGLEQQKAANEAWYERRMNEDPLARASAQRMMTEVADRIKRSNRAAAGQRAVMGGTEESVAATNAANAEALASTASAISANADARRDAAEATYQQRADKIAAQQQAARLGKAQNIAQAVQGAGAAAGAIATSVDSAYEQSAPAAAPAVAPPAKNLVADLDNAVRKRLGNNYGFTSPFTS